MSAPASTAPAASASAPVDAWASLTYQAGFGSHFSSEALPGALPVGQNSPQVCPYGLVAEQLSGTAFTAPRARNGRSWLYRVYPSVVRGPMTQIPHPALDRAAEPGGSVLDPNPLRWSPAPHPEGGNTDWVAGLRPVAASAGAPSGAPAGGLAILAYACDADMSTCGRSFGNSDGDFLLVPQEGALRLTTEFGRLSVAPGEIVVIPRGIRFSVDLGAGVRAASGYVLEVHGAHFQLPELGPLGANGLANPRDFLAPVAAFEDKKTRHLLLNKFGGRLFSSLQAHSPFDVVAWHGNYYPYKYDLAHFNTVGSISYDHPDPSIFTVLTVPTDTPGVALADFVIFPPRWMVAERTFRPPWFHRNCMTEYMGMVYGKYDAKVGFVPGGASLHGAMTPHGPDTPTFTRASAAPLAADHFAGGLAFMFETCRILHVARDELAAPYLDVDYAACWAGMPRYFDPSSREVAQPLVSRPSTGAAGTAVGPVHSDGSAVSR